MNKEIVECVRFDFRENKIILEVPFEAIKEIKIPRKDWGKRNLEQDKEIKKSRKRIERLEK